MKLTYSGHYGKGSYEAVPHGNPFPWPRAMVRRSLPSSAVQ